MQRQFFLSAVLVLCVIAAACHSSKDLISAVQKSGQDITLMPPVLKIITEEVLVTPPPEGRYVRSSFTSKTKGEVPFIAYLPPGWKDADSVRYPLLVYLYGQGGNEYSFARTVPKKQLDQWINQKLIPPMVLICVRGAEIIEGKPWHEQKIQWYTSENEQLLLREEPGELRHFCKTVLHAGYDGNIALEGHSRGATGTLHYALKHPGKFSSYLANCYVSDYAIGALKNGARKNKAKIITQQVPLRMEIGTADFFESKYNRRGTHLMHDYLNRLNIPHQYDTIPGANHHYYYIWNYRDTAGVANGLKHLQYHARYWHQTAMQ